MSRSFAPSGTRRNPLPRALAAAALLLCAAAPLRAQEPDPTGISEALAELEAGQTVRVSVRGGAAVEGGFGGMRGGILLVGEGMELTRIAAADVRGVWVRGRHTRRGAGVGAGLGALGGLGLGLFVAILPLEDEENGDGEIIAAGTLYGAGTGAVLGGIVGAAFPRWKQVYPGHGRGVGEPRVVNRVGGGQAEPAAPSADAGEDAARPARNLRVGLLEGSVGFGRVSGFAGTEGGPGGRIALMGQYRPFRGVVLALGPELEYHGMGITRDPLRRIEPRFDCSVAACPMVGQDTSFFHRQYAAAAARMVVRLEGDGERVRPYALAGAGGHAWIYRDSGQGEPFPRTSSETYGHPGYTLGGGLRVREVLGRRALGLEARRSGVFGAEEDLQPGSYWTVSLTVGSN